MVVFYLIVRALRQCFKLQHYTKLGNGDFVSKFVKKIEDKWEMVILCPSL